MSMHINKLTQNIELQKLMLDFAEARRLELSQEDIDTIIKKKPYYPLLKDNLYNPLKSMLKSLAFKLTVGGQMKNTMRDLLFNNELETKIDLYIQFVAEYLIDNAFGRQVGCSEKQPLEEKLKPFYETDFREFYHRLIYLRSPKMLENFKESNFEYSNESDGVILYGYIDRNAGLSFRGLCCAYIDNEGQMNLSPINKSTLLTIRAGSFDNPQYLDLLNTNVDLSDFTDSISQILEIYDTNNIQIEILRSLISLDPFRHPYFPDDVNVNLINRMGETERVWVRYIEYYRENDDAIIKGELLNEPNKEFGCHLGDIINFKYFGDERTHFLIHME